MPGKRTSRPSSKKKANHSAPSDLRIIGGRMRGRLLAYSGNRGTRPMKERVREAVFNLLGPRVKGKHAIDLFAGTGALGLEAISRGAEAATLIERHFPSVRNIEKNITTLEVADRVEVLASDTFYWANHQFEPFRERCVRPWVVFCSPPYDCYVEQTEAVLQLLQTLITAGPANSVYIVESDDRFDAGCLTGNWDVRSYPPAKVAIFEKGSEHGHPQS